MEREPTPGRKRWSVYRPSKSRVSEGVSTTTEAPPKPKAASSDPPQWAPGGIDRPSSPKRGIIAAIGLTAVVLGMSGFFAYLGSDRDGEGFFGGTSEVQVLTEDGVAGLVEALEEETGRSEAFSATIYPTYAVVRVPVDGTSQREIGYHWDGHDLEEWGSKSTSSNERFDLADIDTSLLPPLVRDAKSQVEDPESWYVIIDHSRDEEGWISAYASNEYSEGGYIEVDLDGREIRRVTWPTTTEP